MDFRTHEMFRKHCLLLFLLERTCNESSPQKNRCIDACVEARADEQGPPGVSARSGEWSGVNEREHGEDRLEVDLVRGPVLEGDERHVACPRVAGARRVLPALRVPRAARATRRVDGFHVGLHDSLLNQGRSGWDKKKSLYLERWILGEYPKISANTGFPCLLDLSSI